MNQMRMRHKCSGFVSIGGKNIEHATTPIRIRPGEDGQLIVQIHSIAGGFSQSAYLCVARRQAGRDVNPCKKKCYADPHKKPS